MAEIRTRGVVSTTPMRSAVDGGVRKGSQLEGGMDGNQVWRRVSLALSVLQGLCSASSGNLETTFVSSRGAWAQCGVTQVLHSSCILSIQRIIVRDFEGA